MMFLTVGDVVFLGKKRVFTLEEAKELLPAVIRVTERAIIRVEEVHRQQTGGQSDLSEAVQAQVQEISKHWAKQIERLGCEAKGLWLVDFDNGAGFYCWRYPENAVGYFHAYDEGFAGRLPIN